MAGKAIDWVFGGEDQDTIDKLKKEVADAAEAEAANAGNTSADTVNPEAELRNYLDAMSEHIGSKPTSRERDVQQSFPEDKQAVRKS